MADQMYRMLVIARDYVRLMNEVDPTMYGLYMYDIELGYAKLFEYIERNL